MPYSTARRFRTGSAPGSPRHTGQTCVFGGAPKRVLQPQKILLAVRSCAWISRPITGSKLVNATRWMLTGEVGLILFQICLLEFSIRHSAFAVDSRQTCACGPAAAISGAA